MVAALSSSKSLALEKKKQGSAVPLQAWI